MTHNNEHIARQAQHFEHMAKAYRTGWWIIPAAILGALIWVAIIWAVVEWML